MTRLYDTSVGSYFDLTRKLAEAGLTAEQVEEILRRPELASGMVAWLREQLVPVVSSGIRLSPRSPSWDASLESKIDTVRDYLGVFGGGRPGFRLKDIPLAPELFTRVTPTEVLMLAVYLPDRGNVPGYLRTLDTWWEFLSPPPGYTKVRWDGLKSDPALLRLLPGIEYRPGIRWVGFDPFANWNSTNGRTVQSLWAGSDSSSLAHAEVLMGARQLHDWLNGQDGTTIPRPDMAGLQRREPATEDESDEESVAAWQHALYLRRWDDDHQLELDAIWAGDVDRDWSAPRVREL
jgi:hypothetical protein